MMNCTSFLDCGVAQRLLRLLRFVFGQYFRNAADLSVSHTGATGTFCELPPLDCMEYGNRVGPDGSFGKCAFVEDTVFL